MIYEFGRWLAMITGWPAYAILFKKKVYYEDKKEQSRWIKGGALIITNHYHALDYMVNMLLFPFRKVYVVVAEMIYHRSKFYHFGMKFFGGIRSDRDIKSMRFMDESIKVLRRGKLVQIFPEARTNDGGELQFFKPSYILIALRAGVPIVPVVTDGNYGIKKRVHVLIGKKIYLSNYCHSENPTKEEIDQLNHMVYEKTKELIALLEEKKCQSLH